MLKAFSKKKVVAGALLAVIAAAGATDWFLANSPYTLSASQSLDYSWERNWFSQTQSIWNFRPGDTVNVYFTDGAIVSFTLISDPSLVTCSAAACIFHTEEPFDDGKIVIRQGPRPANAKPPISMPIPGNSVFPQGYNLTPMPTAQTDTYVPTGTVTITQSPPGGGGCAPKCPPKVN